MGKLISPLERTDGSRAFTATYEEKLASEIYDAQEIVDFLAECLLPVFCEDYVDRWLHHRLF